MLLPAPVGQSALVPRPSPRGAFEQLGGVKGREEVTGARLVSADREGARRASRGAPAWAGWKRLPDSLCSCVSAGAFRGSFCPGDGARSVRQCGTRHPGHRHPRALLAEQPPGCPLRSHLHGGPEALRCLSSARTGAGRANTGRAQEPPLSARKRPVPRHSRHLTHEGSPRGTPSALVRFPRRGRAPAMGWVTASSRGQASSLTTTKRRRRRRRRPCHAVAQPPQPSSACFAPFAFCSLRGPTAPASEGSVPPERRRRLLAGHRGAGLLLAPG